MAAFGYTAQDVAEALDRLSTISAGRTGVDGVAPPSHVDAVTLQSYWQVVAGAATPSGAEPLGEATEHLSAIFAFVEGVMLSCGSPDSCFDIYEASFELLTKIGFFLQSVEAKDLLFRVLEHVNEVYDVLLSCVETYEWVENGVTGMLRLWMLQILFACFGTTVITGRDLMELTDNDVSGAISLVSFLLRCGKAPFAMQATAGRCLVELTTADSVFMRCQEGATDTQNTQIAKLTAMLNTHVNGLIKGIIQFDVIEAFGRCICQHQMSHERTDVVVKYFLTTIHNCLLYCSENQKRLRQHLATQSTIVQDIIVPYVNNILPALYDSPGCGPAMIEWQNLKSTLQTLVVVTFNINVFRPYLQDLDMVMRISGVPGILGHLSMLELLVKLGINIDFTKGPAGGEMFLNTMRAAFEQLPEDRQTRLQRRLTSAQSMRLPYSRTATKAIEAMSFVLVLPEGVEVSPEAVKSRKAQRKQRWRRAKNKARKRKRMFAMQSAKGKDRHGCAPSDSETAAEAGGEEPQDGEEEEEEEDSDEDMPPLIPVSGLDDQLGEADEVGVPSLAVCPLSGTLMHDPVQTPEGHVFERAALEDWVQINGSNPLTGEALELEQCQPQPEIAASIQGFQMMQLSACQIAPEAFEEPLPEAAAASEPPAPALEPAGVPETRPTSLLGDLPSLATAPPAESRKKAKTKIRIESRSVVDCPEDMRCTIDGKVCVNPVRSPYGHLFERKTLERWFMNCGSVCPVTQKPLRLEDCEPDSDMKKRIVKFLKCQQ